MSPIILSISRELARDGFRGAHGKASLANQERGNVPLSNHVYLQDHLQALRSRDSGPLHEMSPAALAQYDPYANDIPTTPDQQDAIDAASDFLTVIGGEDLNGVSISNAALTPGTLGAVTEDGSSIGVDFEALDGLLPPGAGPDSGAVMITIFHELQHLKGWGRDPCSHKKLIVYVASKHCEYIAWLIATGGSTTNACYLYSKIRDSINGAPPPPNCPDDPGPISGCAGCPI